MASDLRPEGLSIVLGGEERHFLFTLNVIDEIQAHYGKTMMEVFEMLTDQDTTVAVTKYIVSALLTDESERAKWLGKKEIKPVSEKDAGWLVTQNNLQEVGATILKAFGFSMPDSDGDNDPNRGSGQTNS